MIEALGRVESIFYSYTAKHRARFSEMTDRDDEVSIEDVIGKAWAKKFKEAV